MLCSLFVSFLFSLAVARLDKEFVGPFGLMLPDVTQLPATFDVLLANLQVSCLCFYFYSIASLPPISLLLAGASYWRLGSNILYILYKDNIGIFFIHMRYSLRFCGLANASLLLLLPLPKTYIVCLFVAKALNQEPYYKCGHGHGCGCGCGCGS